jgi:hypothetical protein
LGSIPYNVEATNPTDSVRSICPTRCVIVFRSAAFPTIVAHAHKKIYRLQSDATARTFFKQDHPQFFFQLLYLAAQGGLRDK